MRKFIAGLSGIALGLMLTGSAFACNHLSDGEITKVGTPNNQLTVKADDKEHTFTAADKTKVLINGEEAKLADVREGDKVAVDFESATDVLAIKVTREG